MTAETTVGHPRLRQLRHEAGWTQQQLAGRLAHLAWTHGQGRIAVNADMIAKWERGAKGISPRYRALLCQLFGVTAEQLGFSSAPSAVSSRPARDAESLVSMLDDAASLLDQLGAAGTALAPQMLSAWKDTATSRRTMLGLLDPAAIDPAGHARAATATLTELEQLAERYHVLHATADPLALLTPVAAHVRMVTAALSQEHTAAQRSRLLRNLAIVATFAGRLAYDDLGDAPSGRAYYSMAADSAREADDHHAAAADALHRAEPTAEPAVTQPSSLFDYGLAHLAAAIGHVHLRAGHHTAARTTLIAALDQLPPTAHRARILTLTDLATAELHAGNFPDACHHATTAAELLHRTPYATGTTSLRAFRAAAARSIGPRALRIFDQHLAHLAVWQNDRGVARRA